ncbi:MAG: DUF411 domain-containing protein [Methylococcaceae bacterium]|nr:DUF411 domain-containing protein [Methylococcaceae bacterium]
MKRLNAIFIIGLFSMSTGVGASKTETDKPDIVVYRSPTCGCCEKWIAHLKQNNFNIHAIVTDNVQSIKDKYGVPQEMASCHTAIVDGYVVEGHVPAKDILTFLKAKPKVTGISVPGMPKGTPGMEMGGKDPYDVVSFDRDHRVEIFSNHEKD